MKAFLPLTAAAALLGLAGCSFSGYDASSSFACKAPEGVLCNSMSGIYANAMAHNLPEQRVHAGSGENTNVTLGSYASDTASAGDKPSKTASGRTAGMVSMANGILPRALDSGAPVHTAPREMRIWFAPWQDADSDLHDQEYVYLVVDPGRWSIVHNQERIRAAFRPVMPPTPAPVTPGNAKPTTTSANNDAYPADGSNADRVMQGILTPAGAVDRAAASVPSGADH